MPWDIHVQCKVWQSYAVCLGFVGRYIPYSTHCHAISTIDDKKCIKRPNIPRTQSARCVYTARHWPPCGSDGGVVWPVSSAFWREQNEMLHFIWMSNVEVRSSQKRAGPTCSVFGSSTSLRFTGVLGLTGSGLASTAAELFLFSFLLLSWDW